MCIVGFLAFAVFMLMWGKSDRRAEEERRGWRLRCVEAGSWAYEEKRVEEWHRAFVMREITDYREPPHHLEIMSPPRWTEYPEWTHGRREEIVARIRSELKEPDYALTEA
jgi:hypothetical protein